MPVLHVPVPLQNEIGDIYFTRLKQLVDFVQAKIDKLNADIGKQRLKTGKKRLTVSDGLAAVHSYSENTGGSGLELDAFVDKAVVFGQKYTQALRKMQARGSQLAAAAVTYEKSKTELLLHIENLTADYRLGFVQQRGCFCEIERFGQGEKGSNLFIIHRQDPLYQHFNTKYTGFQ